MKQLKQNEVLEANKYVHSQLVNMGEYTKSPHFYEENQIKVRKKIIEILEKNEISKNSRMIDFGCGTGFIIHLVKDLFDEIHGIDITPDMMKHIDTKSGNILLTECQAESTPFSDNYFNFATAYSFMDHLFDYKIFLSEVYRVLKPEGVFYSDLNPNSKFIKQLSEIHKYDDEFLKNPIITKEIKGALNNGNVYFEKFGISSDILEKAEPIKSNDKGFNLYEVITYAKSLGFREVYAEYDWFVNEGNVYHLQSNNDRNIIFSYLYSMLPLSEHLFKYVRFIFKK